MYTAQKLHKWNIAGLQKVADILYKCGKDMAQKQNLHHWDNSRVKCWVIIALCTLKNEIYLVYQKNTPVATFQTRKAGDALLFQKLATMPECSGNGIGTFCMSEIERLAVGNGCKEIICEVYDKSHHARDFYEHRGYSVYGTAETLKYNELKLVKKL